ncbi:uncharacterized protein LOC125234482 [Leguminivora glycinivorella]|uniref:uncharacterized protein LOC125234482 n=1 Tax=Leguminivora glycinivorella TaxID=1035111 RepID=UPI00200F354E|nr:uncharacterized protein LOC125234482 [Leguminivora glycinivorella]
MGTFRKGPQRDLVNPEGHFNPEREQLPVENGPVPTDIPEEAGSQNDPKSEDSDLKTDATFWWPFYRSWGSWGYPSYRYRSYWSYPTYRTYWTYPTYRYYRPRTYYRYYYW